MKDFEKLVNSIMADAEADGEPVTREEAEEMAKMEMGEKANRRYEQSEVGRKKTNRPRKIDEEKKYILKMLKSLIEGMQLNRGEPEDVQMKTETELHFMLSGNAYTLKLTKHRPH